MEPIRQEKLVSRSKSMGFLDKLDSEYDFKSFSARFCGYNGSDNPHASVSSLDACFQCDRTDSSAEETKLDSGIGKSLANGETLFVLEQKIETLSELLQEQRNLLMSIKENVISSKAESNLQLDANQICMEVSKDTDDTKSTNETIKLNDIGDNSTGCDADASVASSLLGAIEIKQYIPLDDMIRVALENFLQSDSVKDHVAAATAECVKEVVRGSFCRVVSNAYLPLVERSHRRLVKYVTRLLEDSFTDLEEGTASLFKSIHKTSRSIRMSLERHQNLLEATDPIKNIKVLRTTLKAVLEDELRTWRERVAQALSNQVLLDSSCGIDSQDQPYVEYLLLSPKQPANPGTSVIDSLMRCAVINKHVQDGDINGAFEEALSSSDLSLVMAACRAVDPADCPLQPAVLLSLLQQLATDMVHDTQLKCRYLEEAIISLDKCDVVTREHLHLVVREVRKHLTKFLLSYPKHHARRRVSLILMAAENLLK